MKNLNFDPEYTQLTPRLSLIEENSGAKNNYIYDDLEMLSPQVKKNKKLLKKHSKSVAHKS